jgi:lysophospholipase L1-like esterase
MKTAFRLASLASLALILPALNAHPQPRRLHSRDEDIIYADEYSYIKSYAALGDSYAAGIGVGKLRTESDAYRCSRYDGGYPERIQDTIQAETYKFVACSGDTSKDILEKQFKQLGDGAKFDLITMSAGGNDVGFSDVLKACILIPNGVSTFTCNHQHRKINISTERAV